MENRMSLEKLKEDYKLIQKKYFLPNFREMNEEFQIERIAESETDILIREVRKFVIEKFSNYLRFIESILNPANSPYFVFSIVKALGNSEKEKLSEIHKKITKYEIEVLVLDTTFDEKTEAKLINEAYAEWQKIKKDFLEIVEVVKKNIDNESKEKGKSYFG
jgi:hypothetical protein